MSVNSITFTSFFVSSQQVTSGTFAVITSICVVTSMLAAAVLNQALVHIWTEVLLIILLANNRIISTHLSNHIRLHWARNHGNTSTCIRLGYWCNLDHSKCYWRLRTHRCLQYKKILNRCFHYIAWTHVYLCMFFHLVQVEIRHSKSTQVHLYRLNKYAYNRHSDCCGKTL